MRQVVVIASLAVALSLAIVRPAAADRIKLLAGNQSVGKVTDSSPTEVTVEVGATKKKFATNEIDTITFEGEPNDLSQARIAVRAGRFDDAVAMLNKVDTKKIERGEILTDIEFYKALAAGRLALSGTGSKNDAGKLLVNFEKAHSKNSFHYFEACEVLGDLLAAAGKYDNAEKYYAKIAAAPWPEYKLRAGVLVGRALLGQKQFDRAATRFDDVLSSDAGGKDAERQKLAASLGKAAALAGSGKPDQAVALVDDIIAKADPENLELHARAYNLLGTCYKAADKKKDALLAFLHVDLLYSRFPEQHAEALANLSTLWADVDKADRAAQARATLKEKYPGSTWAQ